MIKYSLQFSVIVEPLEADPRPEAAQQTVVVHVKAGSRREAAEAVSKAIGRLLEEADL